MVTGSEPAGRKTSANPHASAAAPITTASASRTAERGDRITETPADKGSLQIGEGDPDGNSVAHAVGQALAPPYNDLPEEMTALLAFPRPQRRLASSGSGPC